MAQVGGHRRKRGEEQGRVEGTHGVPREKTVRAVLPTGGKDKENLPPVAAVPREKRRRHPRTPLRDITALANSMDWVSQRAAAARRRLIGDPTQEEEEAPSDEASASQERPSGILTALTKKNSCFPPEELPDSECNKKLTPATLAGAAAVGSVKEEPKETAKKMTRPSTLSLMSMR